MTVRQRRANVGIGRTTGPRGLRDRGHVIEVCAIAATLLTDVTEYRMSKAVPVARLAVVISAGLATACAHRPYVVGPNVQVSVAQASLQHYETRIGTDPSQANRLFACAYVVRPTDAIDNVLSVIGLRAF